jgi:SAM-dependent methyltransferase
MLVAIARLMASKVLRVTAKCYTMAYTLMPASDLSPRQQREVEYHRAHAAKVPPPCKTDIVSGPQRRWWSPLWEIYRYLRTLDWHGKRVLVLGCGFGDDLIFMRVLKADVYGCDLSPDVVEVARNRCPEAKLDVMPAEALAYPDGFFDLIICVDILHHCDVPQTLAGLQRVAKDGALLVWSEIYCHSLVYRLRHSGFGQFVWKLLHPWIYGSDCPYITEDERPLSQDDIAGISRGLKGVRRDYWNALIGRAFPDRFRFICKVDRMMLSILGPVAPFLASRSTGHGMITK